MRRNPGGHRAERSAAKVADYIARHVRICDRAGQAAGDRGIRLSARRGQGRFRNPSATTAFRDRYYRQIYGAVEADVARGGPIAGTNFWAWSGEGRAAHADHRFVPGDKSSAGRSAARAARLVRRVRWRCLDQGDHPRARRRACLCSGGRSCYSSDAPGKHPLRPAGPETICTLHGKPSRSFRAWARDPRWCRPGRPRAADRSRGRGTEDCRYPGP